MNMEQNQSNPPPSWGDEKIREIADFYDSLTEEEWIAHYEADYEREGYTHLMVPAELNGPIGRLIAQTEDDRRTACADHPDSTEMVNSQEGNFPPGWNSERVKRFIAEMEEEEAKWTEEDEAELQMRTKGKTSVQVPDELVPAVEAMLARYEAKSPAETAAND